MAVALQSVSLSGRLAALRVGTCRVIIFSLKHLALLPHLLVGLVLNRANKPNIGFLGLDAAASSK